MTRAPATRRRFLETGLSMVCGAALAGCTTPLLPALIARPPLIGYLTASSLDANTTSLEAFRQGLADWGYVEGRNVTLEVRAADGRQDRLLELAAELVHIPVNVIVTGGGTAIQAVRNATSTIPIVFDSAGDPVAEGLVTSLAHPGGNVTGLTNSAGDEDAKRLQLLTEVFPDLKRVATLGTSRQANDLAQTQAAATTLNVQILSLELQNPDELEAILSGALTSGADGLVVFSDALFMPLASRMVTFAATHRLPAIYATSTYAVAGGLLVYGVNIPDNARRAAAYVDKILRGASPADLPVERPTKYDFVVNLQTARALGFSIPDWILAEATQIVQ